MLSATKSRRRSGFSQFEERIPKVSAGFKKIIIFLISVRFYAFLIFLLSCIVVCY